MSLTFWKSRQVDPETMSASTPAEGLNLCGKPQGEQDLILKRHNDVAETRPEISRRFLTGIFVIELSESAIYDTSSSRASRWRKFQKKKNYIAEKEFAYRMCARWPTIAMSKLFWVGLNEAFAVARLWCHALWGYVFVIWLAFKWCG